MKTGIAHIHARTVIVKLEQEEKKRSFKWQSILAWPE